VYDVLDVGVKAEGAGGEGTLALLEVLDKREGRGLEARDFEGLDGVVRPSKLIIVRDIAFRSDCPEPHLQSP